jgi:hypothetical protein
MTGIEEKVKAKGIRNIQQNNPQNFPNLQKEISIQIQVVYRTPNRHGKNKSSPWLILIKTLSTENKEIILKAVRKNIKSPIKVNPSE